MASPYPIELRTGVIDKTESGMKIVEVSRLFNVHRETIASWIKRCKETGDYSSKQHLSKAREIKRY